MKNLAILAVGVLSLAASANCQTTATVRFTDLDLASPAGKAVLAQRIGNAAGAVCGVETGTTGLDSHVAARACRAHAIDTAMHAVALKIAPRYASR